MSSLLHAKRALEKRLGCSVHFERGPFTCSWGSERGTTHHILVTTDEGREVATGRDHHEALERAEKVVACWRKRDAEEYAAEMRFDAWRDEGRAW